MGTEGLTPQAALRARRRAAGFQEVTVWVPAEFRAELVDAARELLNRAAFRGRVMPGDAVGEYIWGSSK